VSTEGLQSAYKQHDFALKRLEDTLVMVGTELVDLQRFVAAAIELPEVRAIFDETPDDTPN
jgi:hypothetical protein